MTGEENVCLPFQESKAVQSEPVVWSSRWLFRPENIISLALGRDHAGYKALSLLPA